MSTYFPPQPGQDVKIWADEQIWGHRLHDEQTPWLTMLEFLTILLHHRDHPLQGYSEPTDRLRYRAQQQLRLRHVLFNSPEIADLESQTSLSSAEKWRRWRSEMDGRKGVSEDSVAHWQYLEDRLGDFGQLAGIVDYLRRTSVPGLASKRWTTRFTYPFGPVALYEDLRWEPQENSFGPDRLFFARTGELLYLMLCRSKQGAALGQRLVTTLLADGNPSAGLIAVLQGETESGPQKLREGGVLPYRHLPVFDRLAEDWMGLLDRELPALDVLPHLVTITTLHLLRYFLEQAATEIGEERPLFVLELNVSRRSPMREASTTAYDRNQNLPWRAVEHLLSQIKETDAWRAAVEHDGALEELIDILRGHFLWPSQKREATIASQTTPDSLIGMLLDDAKERHRGHVGNIHGLWSREIGLASRRGSRQYRYAPTDRFLKTLVLTRVPERIELKSLLEDWYERFGIVITGQAQQTQDLLEGVTDAAAYENNVRYLEERLISLGLAERLSDQCAYVRHGVKDDV
jgi:hypothetical protein